MIDDVRTKRLKVNLDERGYLMEILRCDEDFFKKFGQCYITTCFPGTVKAWHMHKEQEDNICALVGNIKLVLADRREASRTFDRICEFFIGERNPVLIKVPPGIYHGFTALKNSTAMVLNIPDRPYDREDPDEYRLPFDSEEIGYVWEVKNR